MSDINPNENFNNLFLETHNNNNNNYLKYILIGIIIFFIIKLCMKYKEKPLENFNMLNDMWYNNNTNACCGSGCGYIPNTETTDLAGDNLPYTQEDINKNNEFYNNELIPNSYTTYGGYQCIPNDKANN